MADDLLDRAAVADLLGVAPDTVTIYRCRGNFPAPDRMFGRSPAWYRSTIEEWRSVRPGRGAGSGGRRATVTGGMRVEARPDGTFRAHWRDENNTRRTKGGFAKREAAARYARQQHARR